MHCAQVGPVRGVYHKNYAIFVLVVVLPEAPQGNLPSHLPDSQGPTANINGLHIESIGWRRFDLLLELQLVEDGGLPSIVEARHEEADIVLSFRT